ncbi:MAG: type II toxin-antitoxin system RelE/ParE family toxin [Clostridiales bacterium]|nr:type II toxin-antitoxin system RelE/ParE family toxin [Clostridiales bacterium]
MSDSRYCVIVSDRAKRMLAMNLRFLAQIDKKAANKQMKLIMTAIRSLETMPNRFPFFDEDYVPKNKYHKMFVEKNYLILFQIRDFMVYVEYVIDCREDYGWLVR